jgi:PDZ domain
LRARPIHVVSILAIFASLVIGLGARTEVRAGTLPNISGRWYANGNPTAACHISQSGNSVSLTNEQGATATGHFVDPSRLSTNWGFMNRITGTISSDLRRITWSNGTYWSRPSTSPLTPVATPSPTPSPEPLRVSVHVRNNATNPIYVHRASLTNGWQPFTYAQCVSFRNVATRVVTVVDFSFVVTNRNGGVEADYGWADKGTFTPPVDINNHCFGGWLWAPHVVRRMTDESVRVTHVTFADGTSWQPGMPFLRGFTTSGAPLPQPTVQSQENGAPEESATHEHLDNLLGLAFENRPSGVYVKFVAPGSPSAAAGIRQGDRIVSIGSNKVSSVTDVRTILSMTPKGTSVPMLLDRDGETLNVTVTP